jgi:uncharacterized membrane protein
MSKYANPFKAIGIGFGLAVVVPLLGYLVLNAICGGGQECGAPAFIFIFAFASSFLAGIGLLISGLFRLLISWLRSRKEKFNE